MVIVVIPVYPNALLPILVMLLGVLNVILVIERCPQKIPPPIIEVTKYTIPVESVTVCGKFILVPLTYDEAVAVFTPFTTLVSYLIPPYKINTLVEKSVVDEGYEPLPITLVDFI